MASNNYNTWKQGDVWDYKKQKWVTPEPKEVDPDIDKLSTDKQKKKVTKIKDQQVKAKDDFETAELKELRAKLDNDTDYTMDGSVKQLFLNLTKMQIPFDYEYTLEEFFPAGMKTDEHGNYYIKIGETKSMFCAHLDTYCYQYKRVWHTFSGDTIGTDGTTTLGGDDKAGIVVMIKMIEAGVPGLYYFFRGEEGVTSPTGTWGSKQALKSYKDNFKKYDRCIAFDRKRSDSIITQQMYSACCSDEFAEQLIKDLGQNGLTYKEDDTGMWCDSGVFMELIPECTNVSMGYNNEHTFNETQDIGHLEKLTNACVKIDWESLPTKRDPKKVSKKVGRYNYDYDYNWDSYYGGRYNYGGYSNSSKKTRRSERKTKSDGNRDYTTMDEMFKHVIDILKKTGYESLNNEFEETEEMYFQNYETNDFFGLRIIDYDIFISEDDTLRNYSHIGDLDTFESYLSELVEDDDNLDDDANSHLDSIIRGYNNDKKSNKSTQAEEEEEEEDDDAPFATDPGLLSDFTTNQEKAFAKLLKTDKKIVKKIIKDVEEKNILEVKPDTWIALEKSMLDAELVIDYGDYGINPDDFIDWMGQNWDKCIRMASDDNDHNTKTNKIDDKGVLSTLTEQDAIYYDIALNHKRTEIEQFIKQVIQKDHVIKKEDYDKYQKDVDSWIKKDYSKELNNNNNAINHKTFIDWLKKNQSDLLSYYM